MPLPHVDSIRSPRVTIRSVQEADLADLMEVNGDAEVTQFLPYATWSDTADGEAWLVRMHALAATGTGRQLVIVRSTDCKVIGTVLLFRFDEASSRVELGYVLGRAYWRQGYAREALRALLEHAYGPLSIRRIEAEVNPRNHASNALLRSLGFRLEGTLRQRWVAKGVAYDVNVYGQLATDWQVAQTLGQ